MIPSAGWTSTTRLHSKAQTAVSILEDLSFAGGGWNRPIAGLAEARLVLVFETKISY